jgi:hypothetical protein
VCCSDATSDQRGPVQRQFVSFLYREGEEPLLNEVERSNEKQSARERLCTLDHCKLSLLWCTNFYDAGRTSEHSGCSRDNIARFHEREVSNKQCSEQLLASSRRSKWLLIGLSTGAVVSWLASSFFLAFDPFIFSNGLRALSLVNGKCARLLTLV